MRRPPGGPHTCTHGTHRAARTDTDLHRWDRPGSQARMIACLDLEGVLVPEIWINVAEATGIDALRITTRDEPDYDKLMRNRIRILDERGLTLTDIQGVIRRMARASSSPGCAVSIR